MRTLIIVAATFVSATLILPTVSQARSAAEFVQVGLRA